MDIELLSNVFHLFTCPSFHCQTISLTEKCTKKKGVAYAFAIIFSSCDFEHEFYSSVMLQNGALDVNKRIVYSMRSIGQGHAGMETFCMLMNMPKPLTSNNYKKLRTSLFLLLKMLPKKQC